ncbi:MAG: ATP-binding cassette domain-containing protein, partial [Thermoleophilaceae bacterium]
MSPVLATQGVSVSFGGVHALMDVDLEVQSGQLVGLIGPNGAGKTTFVDAITGFVRCAGRIELDGHDLTVLRPHERSALGLSRTWQSTELFDDLTVRENLTVAAHRPSAWEVVKELFKESTAAQNAVDRALELVELTWAAGLMARPPRWRSWACGCGRR